MSATFAADGLGFSYPEDWTLEREEEENGWTVTVQSPGTAFALVRLDLELTEPSEVVEATLKALRDDYPDLEAETAMDLLAGEMAIGYDIEFFSLDMTVTCWMRSLYAGAGTVLVMCQFSDAEQEVAEPVLRALCASLYSED
jgi:hypothetical protein